MKPRYLALIWATALLRDSIVRRMENPARSGIRRLREQRGGRPSPARGYPPAIMRDQQQGMP